MSSSSLERTCLRSFAQTSILLHFGNFMKLVCTSNQHASPLHCQLVRSAVTLLSLCLPLAACHARASSTSTGLCNSTTICHQYILHLSKDVCQQTFMGDSDVNRTWTNGRKTDLCKQNVCWLDISLAISFHLIISSVSLQCADVWLLFQINSHWLFPAFSLNGSVCGSWKLRLNVHKCMSVRASLSEMK